MDPDAPAPVSSSPLFAPKLFSTIRNYTLQQFWGDLAAGVTVGIVALPLAIAFGIASGVTPEKGIITAIVAGFLVSALGGSRVQIGGPTGAFVVIVAGIIDRYGMNGLILCTMLAGLILIFFGLLRLGAIIQFIPYPLVVGFTSGIAVVIFSSQIKDFFGLQIEKVPVEFVEKWELYFEKFSTLHGPTSLLACACLLFLLLWPKISRRIPASIVAIVLSAFAVQLFQLPVETIGSRFGELPSGLPAPVWPQFDLSELRNLISPAVTVALLCAIESLLSATVADGMIEGRHRPNTELIGQGIANFVTPLFGGIPATGAIARTATNVKNGASTPVAGIIHALSLLLIVLLCGQWVRFVPMCVLAAILFVVCYHMSEWRAFRNLLRAPKTDVVVLLVTFALTVLVDLTVAVEVGMLLAMVLFLKRMTDVSTIKQIHFEMNQRGNEAALRAAPDSASRYEIPPQVQVYEAEGAFFFGVAASLRDLLSFGRKPPKVLILRTRHLLAIDATGIRALQDLKRSCDRMKIALLIEGIHAQPLFALQKSGLYAELGEENVLGNLEEALVRARKLIGT